MRAVADQADTGRWVWAVSGVITALILTVAALRFATHPEPGDAFPRATAVRTVTVPGTVNTLDVSSDGGPVRITAGTAGAPVRVTEDISYPGKANGAPPVPESVSDSPAGRRLTLAAPTCPGGGGCSAAFTLSVPRGTAADVNSRGGSVTVTGTGGSVSVVTDGGPVLADGLSGALRASSGGGSVDARELTSSSATVTTGGGAALVSFAAAPRTASVSSDGGPARVGVPGGPYALTTDSGGGREQVNVPTDPAAGRSLTVSSGGGRIVIGPPAAP